MNRLFEKSEINGMVLTNRFIRSATFAGMATDEEGRCTSSLIELMAGLAEGGVGLIITGHTYVHRNGKHQPRQMGIDRDELIPDLQAMTRAVHERGGKIALQLGYGGAYLSKSRVRMMTHRDIQELVEAFGQAAVRAKKAGFDGVQIFAAHGFFLSQLLCPRYNDRRDHYGGVIENRARALMEVLQSIRAVVGRDYPVLVKLNSHDMVEDGLTLADSIRVGTMLEEGGIDAIELSGGLLNLPGLLDRRDHSEEEEVFFKREAMAFREKIQTPLILVGGIRSYRVAESLLEHGDVDYISMSRPFIREPGLINRWKAGDHGRASCISCNNCVEQIKKGKGLSCVPLEYEKETFFPQLSETIPASPPFPSGTHYRVSMGIEKWESAYLPVIKVEMVIEGRVSPKSPSFPLGREDHQKVNKAIAELMENYANMHGKE